MGKDLNRQCGRGSDALGAVSRRFKSCPPDHLSSFHLFRSADRPQLVECTSHLPF